MKIEIEVSIINFQIPYYVPPFDWPHLHVAVSLLVWWARTKPLTATCEFNVKFQHQSNEKVSAHSAVTQSHEIFFTFSGQESNPSPAFGRA